MERDGVELPLANHRHIPVAHHFARQRQRVEQIAFFENRGFRGVDVFTAGQRFGFKGTATESDYPALLVFDREGQAAFEVVEAAAGLGLFPDDPGGDQLFVGESKAAAVIQTGRPLIGTGSDFKPFRHLRRNAAPPQILRRR